ncbi:MAG: HAD family hydrolase [Anaerolineae bacterium]|nr:HAD family hydrolase [Anaerolineae bacterium]
MSKYKAILFDLDGTLRANLPEGFEVFVEYAALVGIQLNDEQMRAVEREAHRYWANAVQVDNDLMRYDKREFWVNYNRNLLTAVGAPPCDNCEAHIQDLFDTHYDPQDVLFADTFTVLEKLRSDGFTLGLVTNRTGEVDTYATKLRIREYFHFTLTGGQANSYKPNPAIFHQALRMAGNIPPEQTLYIGDNYFADVCGARGVGMDAVLIDPRNCFVGMHPNRVRHLRDVLKYIEQMK